MSHFVIMLEGVSIHLKLQEPEKIYDREAIISDPYFIVPLI